MKADKDGHMKRKRKYSIDNDIIIEDTISIFENKRNRI